MTVNISSSCFFVSGKALQGKPQGTSHKLLWPTLLHDLNFAHYSLMIMLNCPPSVCSCPPFSTSDVWRSMTLNSVCSGMCPFPHVMTRLSKINMHAFPPAKAPCFVVIFVVVVVLERRCFGNYPQCSPLLVQVINFFSFLHLLVMLIGFVLIQGEHIMSSYNPKGLWARA